MSEVRAPAAGEVSPDRQFIWDGVQWKPITGFHWIPTGWTRPMQLAAGAYFALAGLYSIISVLVFASAFREVMTKQAQRNPSLTPDQVTQTVTIGIAAATVVAIVFGVLYLLLAAVTVGRRWSWVFYADLVLLFVGALGIFGAIAGLASPGASGQPAGASLLTLVFGLAAAGLFVWLLLGRIQRGVWACRRTPTSA